MVIGAEFTERTRSRTGTMRRMNRRVLILGAILAPAFALAQPRLALGIKAGVFYPTDSGLRQAFGDNWTSIGISPVRLEAKNGTRQSTDFAITARSKNGNRVFMLRPTFGVSKSFDNRGDGSVVPYVAARAGLAYIDYSIENTSRRFSGNKFGFTGNVEFGVVFNQRFAILARYDMMPRFDGFNFSGFSLEAAVQVLRF